MGIADKQTFRSLGIILVFLTFITIIIELVLIGLDFKLLGAEWQPFIWRPLPVLQTTMVIFSFMICMIGYVTFQNPNLNLYSIYASFILISVILNFSIGLFAVLASSLDWGEMYFGCNSHIEDIAEMHRSIDTYVHIIDQSLCSEWCPCNLYNVTAFTKDKYIFEEYKKWNTTNVQNNETSQKLPVNFQSCAQKVRVSALEGASFAESYFIKKGLFKVNNFHNYMATLENKFQCSGWCETNYNHWDTDDKTFITKYLFTDVNKGPPKNGSCAKKVLDWLPLYLAVWGGVTLVMALFEILIFALCLYKCCLNSKNNENGFEGFIDESERLATSFN